MMKLYLQIVYFFLLFVACNKKHVVTEEKQGHNLEYQTIKDENDDFIKDGFFRTYFDNKQLAIEGTYEKGYKTGVWTSWHRNGTLESKGKYKNDCKAGDWIEKNENGVVTRLAYYKNCSDTMLLGDWIITIGNESYIFSFNDHTMKRSDEEGFIPYKEELGYLSFNKLNKPEFFIRKNINDTLSLGVVKEGLERITISSQLNFIRHK